jgi:uncharacterized protein Veg
MATIAELRKQVAEIKRGASQGMGQRVFLITENTPNEEKKEISEAYPDAFIVELVSAVSSKK